MNRELATISSLSILAISCSKKVEAPIPEVPVTQQIEELAKRVERLEDEVAALKAKQFGNPRDQEQSIESSHKSHAPDADSSRTKIELPFPLVEVMPVNGDFENGLDSWIKWFGPDDMNSQRVCEVIYDQNKASHIVELRRSEGGVSGSLFGLAQDIYIDLSKYDELYLKLDVKAIYQSLRGGGWAGAAEYPVVVELAFVDQNNIGYKWRCGFYYLDESSYKDGTKVPEGEWFSYTSPNLKKMIPVCADETLVADANQWYGDIYHVYRPPIIPKSITRVLILGGGWDFIGQADNLRFATRR